MARPADTAQGRGVGVGLFNCRHWESPWCDVCDAEYRAWQESASKDPRWPMRFFAEPVVLYMDDLDKPKEPRDA